MAVRKEVGEKVIVSAGKTYTFKDSVKDMASMESEGVERLIADCTEEALSELKEGEEIVQISSGFFTKNMATHFWVVLIAERRGEKTAGAASASESESGG